MRVCGLVRLFCLPARLSSRRRGFRIKVAVSLPPASSTSLSFSLARARALSRLLNARHMLLHLRDEQLESGAQTEIKPLLLLLSNSETCSLLSRECEGSLPPFWLRRLSPGEKVWAVFSTQCTVCFFELFIFGNLKVTVNPMSNCTRRLLTTVSTEALLTFF